MYKVIVLRNRNYCSIGYEEEQTVLLIKVVIIDYGMSTIVNILYPHNLIVTSANPAPYIEYDVPSFKVKNLFTSISWIPRYVKLANNITIIIIWETNCLVKWLFLSISLLTPSKNMLNEII